MLTRAQIILLKRAQQQARIDDAEYRLALGSLSKLDGCTSSTDPRLGDEHLDLFLKYFESIYWVEVDQGKIVHIYNARAVFQQRGFWLAKNPKANTSRDRYTEANVGGQIAGLEAQLQELGCGPSYVAAIKRNIQPYTDWKYKAALERTLQSKRKKKEQVA